MADTPNSDGKPPAASFDLLSIGIASALMIGIALLIGLGLDAWLGTSPVFVLLGLAVGVASAVASTVRRLRRML